jgi:ATP-dependent Clp protease ATP-binding subunit ClpA
MSVSGQRICRLAEAVAEASDPEVALNTLCDLRRELDEFERQQVARALTAGGSFGAVARAIGISRQAAHRRFRDLAPRRRRAGHRLAPTPEVRLAIDYAQEEAAQLGSGALEPKHVLLGILRNGDRRGAAALVTAGVTLEDARRAAREPDAHSDDGVVGVRAVLAQSVRCAARRGAERIEVEDLVRGALSDGQAGAGDMLRTLGVAPDRVVAALDAPRGDDGCSEA